MVGADILFAHIAINVFKYNTKAEECSDGYKSSELLKHYKQIISGHFHARQEKKYKNGEVLYVGNPFQMDFSDEGLEKGFAVYDLDTGTYEFVNNEISPKFIRYKLTELSQIKDFEKLKNTLSNSYFKLIIDASIMTQDLNTLMSLVNGCGVKSAEFEWENGRNFSQDIIEQDYASFELVDAIHEYIGLLDIPYKADIENYIIGLYYKITN